MSRSRLIFFAIIGVALLIVVGTTLIAPQLTTLSANQALTATAQYQKNNTVTIRVVYGTEKERWFKDAIDRFQTANPGIKVDMAGQGSMDTYQALSALTDSATTFGKDPIPAVWSPAATIQVNLLNSNNIPNRQLAANCKRLVLSPLVIMAWEDRAKAFETYYKDKGGITFANLYDALDPNGKVKGKWEALGGQAAWGYIKIGHTDPQKSNSGVMMLMAMANNYYQRTSAVKVEEVTGGSAGDAFVNWMTTIEKGVTTPLNASTGTFVNDLIVKGPASFDFAIAYEALAIENYKNATGRQQQGLRIIYPAFNIYSDHPLCLIDHPAIDQRQRAAAQKLQDFLLSPDVQKLAVTYGFRPADPSIPVFGTGSDFDNADLKTAGISANIGQELQLPDGSTITALINSWKRNFGQ